MGKLILNTDGGSRNNPGPAAIGYIVRDSAGKVLEKCGKYIGEHTNNEAEYKALIEGLKASEKFTKGEIKCFLDSNLVVNQLNGNFKIKKPHLAKLIKEIKKLERGFSKVEYNFVKRDRNFLADSLVNEALDKKGF